MFGAKDVEAAYERIQSSVIKTPLIRAENLDEFFGCEVYLKLENLQKTGSFKYRGVMNKILSLSEEDLKKGVVCASSGNHGKAVAFACKNLNIPATVVMPDTAPKIKIEAIKSLGAKIVMATRSERFAVAQKISDEEGKTMIPPYDDEYVMAGQGTSAVEMLDQVPDLDYILVPVSGGGLVGGISAYVHGKNFKTKVIGVEPKNAAAYTYSFEAGKRVDAPFETTVADALVSTKPGEKNFPVVKENVYKMVNVSEDYIKKAWRIILFDGKILCEPSSAIGAGAILEKKLNFEKNEKVCFVISGGSISVSQIAKLGGIE